jgi:hypothetical protein
MITQNASTILAAYIGKRQRARPDLGKRQKTRPDAGKKQKTEGDSRSQTSRLIRSSIETLNLLFCETEFYYLSKLQLYIPHPSIHIDCKQPVVEASM